MEPYRYVNIYMYICDIYPETPYPIDQFLNIRIYSGTKKNRQIDLCAFFEILCITVYPSSLKQKSSKSLLSDFFRTRIYSTRVASD